MIYVLLKHGNLFFDSDLFDFMVVGNLIFLFNDHVCVANFSKDFVKIIGEHDEILYLGEKFKKVEDN